MTPQVLYLDVFFEENLHLNAADAFSFLAASDLSKSGVIQNIENSTKLCK